jgi:hypothetical protein
MQYHYVYRVTSLIENKHYYGLRTSTVEPALDLGIKYFTSSTDLEFKNDLKQNTFNYRLKIISTFKNRNEAILFEIKLHNRFNVKNHPSFYNRSNQSAKGFDRSGILTSKDTKKLISNSIKGIIRSEETKKKISESRKGYIMPVSSRIKLSNSKKGTVHSEETKKKMSDSSKGQIMSPEARDKISNALCNKAKTKEHALNISKSLIGFKYKEKTCVHCGLTGRGGNMSRFHFDNCKNKQ